MFAQYLDIIINFLLTTIGSLGYIGIFILMAIESSIFPLPAELVLIPAGFLAYQGEMSLTIILICATLGSLVGASLNYIVALKLGRKTAEYLINKYGKFLFISQDSISKTESFFSQHGSMATFTGRLAPVIRHLISLPAGFAKMNFLKFSTYTLAGAFLSSAILVYFGFFFGMNYDSIQSNLQILTLLILILCLSGYIIYLKIKK